MSPITKLVLIAVFASGATLLSPAVAQADVIKPPTFALPVEVPQGTKVRIDGSESMSVINQALKRQFEQDYPDAQVELDAHGTDAALEALLNDEIDLAAIGRRLTSAEKAKGLAEIPLSQDRIAVIVGRDNPFRGNLTIEQFVQILRGDITDWSQVGGVAGPIRVIDRPATSDTRIALSRYGIFAPDGLVVHDAAVKADDTAAVINALGRDGIGYAIASQLTGQNKARLVKIVIPYETLPDDPLYPYSQIRGYAYKKGQTPVGTRSFLGFAEATPGKAALADAKLDEAEAVVAAFSAAARDQVIARDWQIKPWLWIFLPLIGAGLLLQAILRWLKRPTYSAATPNEPAVPSLQSTAVLEESEPSVESPEGIDAIANDAPIIDPYTQAARLAASEQYAEALPYFAQTVTQSPDFVAGWVGLGMALVQTEQLEEALVSFDRAIALSPDLPEVWVAKGEALTALGRTEEAQVCFERAGVAPMASLVEALTEPLASEPVVEAPVLEEPISSALVDEAVVDQANPQALYEAALEQIETGRFEQALPLLEQAIALNSTFSEALVAQANALIGIGQLDEALTSVERAIELSPEYGFAWASRGDALLRLGRVDEAQLSFEQAGITPVALSEATVLEFDPLTLEPSTAMHMAVGTLGSDVSSIKQALLTTLSGTFGKTRETATLHECYQAMAILVRDRLFQCETPDNYLINGATRLVAELSAEFLPGRQLQSGLTSLGLWETAQQAWRELGLDPLQLLEQEPDPGLGRGGLGQLMNCYLDSMATLGIPAIGYGIRYEYGSFDQDIRDGWQVEMPDEWLHNGNPWEVERPEAAVEVYFGGRSEAYLDAQNQFQMRWLPDEVITAVPYDMAVPGTGSHTVNWMRLWRADAAENLSKVLYPSDIELQGKQVRLRQHYFLVSTALQDILRSHLNFGGSPETLPQRFTIQLNDTDTLLAIPELMRLLMDQHGLTWDAAWAIVQQTFAYTNHSLLPEALDPHHYPLPLVQQHLPRHFEIILNINCRFLNQVRERYGETDPRVAQMSCIEETDETFFRLVNLACISCYAVNGVSSQHTTLLQRQLAPFSEFFPEKFHNVTNGVSPRRFLQVANPPLTQLITRQVGEGWLTQLGNLERLSAWGESLGDIRGDRSDFYTEWRQIKRRHKQTLATLIAQQTGVTVNVDSLFDVQAMEIHEHNRQLLNVLHVLTLYDRLKVNPNWESTPRTVIFSGKASPDYFTAKLILKLIHTVADRVNSDPAMEGRLNVVFLKDFGVTLSQHLFAAADVAQFISTAGTEAGATGNLVAALNGAAILGTPDGTNLELQEAIGSEHMFLFGLTTEEISSRKMLGYTPADYIDGALSTILEQITTLAPDNPLLFKPLVDSLRYTDPYFVLADYHAYIECQKAVGQAFRDVDSWTRRSILTTAGVGHFSSERAIRDYQAIWRSSIGSPLFSRV